MKMIAECLITVAVLGSAYVVSVYSVMAVRFLTEF